MKDILRYDKMVETALRGVVREVLARTATSGLPGAHHFYITFRTGFPGVGIPEHLLKQYPEEMTVVVENQFWDLEVTEERFAVTLNFKSRPDRLSIPFAAITAFADPSVKFGLQFQVALPDAPETPPAPEPRPAKHKEGEVVTLDAFRKK